MNEKDHQESPKVTPVVKRRRGVYLSIAGGIVLLCMLLAGWWYYHNFHANPYRPVELTAPEQQVLEEKLDVLGVEAGSGEFAALQPVRPPLSEEARLDRLQRERRTVVITEREINAILHHNTDLADKVRVRFVDGGVGANAIIPVPEDAPFLGGRTVRVGLAVAAFVDDGGGLAVILRDVTLNGVPLPNAWLADLKGRNIMDGESGQDPFLRALAEGIEEVEVTSGELRIVLAE